MIRFLVHFRNGSVLWSENAKPFAEKYRAENTAYGGLAQLGERLAGSQKVSGSSPLSSTSRRWRHLAVHLPSRDGEHDDTVTILGVPFLIGGMSALQLLAARSHYPVGFTIRW